MNLLKLLAGLTLIVSAHAQQAPEQISTELLTLSVDQNLKPLHYMNDGQPVEIKVTMAGMGGPTAYVGNRTLRLYADAADLMAKPEGEPAPVPVAQVTLPKEKRILILFSQGPGGAQDVRMRAIGIAESMVGKGDYMVFNFSRSPIGVMMDQMRVGVKSGHHEVLSSAAWKQEVKDLNVKLGVASENQVIPAYSSVWGHRPVRRSFVLVFDRNDKGRPLDVRRFHDLPDSKPINQAALKADAGPIDRH